MHAAQQAFGEVADLPRTIEIERGDLERRPEIVQAIYSILATFRNDLGVAGFLAYWGLIGVRVWAL